jgi:pimeloyl-ACP methyl ester carboxylesterase
MASSFWRAAGRRGAGARAEFARRTALARQPRPEGVSGPPLRYLLGELRTWRRVPDIHRPGPAEHPQPVMILPGFGAHPRRMQPMASALEAAGHSVSDWGLGLNLGPTPENFAFLMRRVGAIARRHGNPVALVGWSLGGLFAREIARRQPDSVSRVITMGTPFSGNPRANNVWRAYQVITGHAVDAPPVECEFRTKPPVPTIALWSPRDGVIHPRSACGWPEERDRAVALRCTHLGFASDPAVVAEVLRQLDLD